MSRILFFILSPSLKKCVYVFRKGLNTLNAENLYGESLDLISLKIDIIAPDLPNQPSIIWNAIVLPDPSIINSLEFASGLFIRVVMENLVSFPSWLTTRSAVFSPEKIIRKTKIECF